ncbi:unnamed protein product [Rotaria sp. Silwood2]|nr:unnamed protein product [Rotaria sp. Silwood2]CAF4182923.1 unnamed protein product [Rotaria sp. Silwood2]
MNIVKNGPRTSLDIIEALTWWYKYFLPHELISAFYLNRCWSIYDRDRDINIANSLRNRLGTEHSNAIIQSVLAFFNSRPDIQLLQDKLIDDYLFSNSTFIHLIPFTDICPLCERKLSANDSHSRQVKVICEQGKILFVAGKFPSAGCYDDGCHLIQYLHKHIGKDLKATDAALTLSNVKFSVDRTHFKNHIGKWCLANMNPADNRLLDGVNTEAAEQNFSWLKKYSSIISALGWRRAPVFLLLLFHMKNLAHCHVRPNRVFDIVNQCHVVQDASLPHSERITQVPETNSSLNLKCTSPAKSEKQTDSGNKNTNNVCLLGPTNTDWTSQVAMIRKNHNIVDKRRDKKLKRL